ncbi:MAG TPA: septum formation initiator family protein [Solirubrobacteraceae bacterium]|nr:septum formation initiator family protein [Solirubrobacteraceae bacterium]
MPPARSASSAARTRSGSASGSTARARAAERQQARAAGRPKPRHVPLRSAAIRLRWERMGRIALLVVLGAVVAVYAEHAVSYLSTRAQNARQNAIVRSLELRHAQLEQSERTLNDPTTIIRRARQLGMTRAGEQPYVMTGQSGR